MRKRGRKMKLLMTLVLIVIACGLLAFVAVDVVINAKEMDEPIGPIEMEATAYCYGTTRCDGGNTYDGICAAKKEWYGKVAAIYEDDGSGNIGKFIGYYECLDTGGEAIREGKTIDIYHPSYDWCRKFGRKKVLVMLIDGEG